MVIDGLSPVSRPKTADFTQGVTRGLVEPGYLSLTQHSYSLRSEARILPENRYNAKLLA